MIRVVGLVAFALVLVWPLRVLLLRAHWPLLAPRAAIALWQSVGVATGIAILGACFELASSTSASPGPRRSVSDFTGTLPPASSSTALTPNQLFGLTAGLIVVVLLGGALISRAVGTARKRASHRRLLELIGDERPGISNALVIEHPRATAYSLPGLHPKVVLSTGALETLARDEIVAVLAHERAHLRARHDLVLFPFRSLANTLPSSRVLCGVHTKVHLLVEMAADDAAIRKCGPDALARALCRLSTADSSFDVPRSNSDVLGRVERVSTARRSARPFVLASLCSAVAVLALPLIALLVPLGGR